MEQLGQVHLSEEEIAPVLSKSHLWTFHYLCCHRQEMYFHISKLGSQKFLLWTLCIFLWNDIRYNPDMVHIFYLFFI